jgi:uncharacterized membrane protein YqjE
MDVTQRASDEERPVKDLLRDALDGSRDLVRVEVELAKNEAKRELGQALSAAAALAVAASFALLALAMFLVALVLAISPTPGAAIAVGAVLVVMAAVAGAVGYNRRAGAPLRMTRRRVERDLRLVKEHVA